MRACCCRLVGTLSVLGLTIAPPALAAPPSSDSNVEGEADAPLDPALEKARVLHNEGSAAYDLADYPTALEKFSAAYVALPDGPQTAGIRSAIVYNVGITQKRMYELDGDVVHLKTAKVLLTRYFNDFAEEGAQEDAKGRALLDEIETELARHKTEAEAAAAAPVQQPREPAPEPTPAPTGPDDPDAQRTARILIGVGGGVLGLGVVGAGLGLGGALWGQSLEGDIEDGTSTGVRRISALEDGRSANALAIGGAVAGGVLLTAGAVVLALGLKKRKDAGRSVALAPTGSGLVLGGRF
ncbi:MAG: hypothetical protein ACRBN8_16520 [Nannocystales bacterium]